MTLHVVPIHRTYRLDEIALAHEDMEAGRAVGKLVGLPWIKFQGCCTSSAVPLFCFTSPWFPPRKAIAATTKRLGSLNRSNGTANAHERITPVR